MPTLLQIVADAVMRLAATGAADNAAYEVRRAERSVIELHTQLRAVSDVPPRAA